METGIDQLKQEFEQAEKTYAKAFDRAENYTDHKPFNAWTYYAYLKAVDRAWDKRMAALKALHQAQGLYVEFYK